MLLLVMELVLTMDAFIKDANQQVLCAYELENFTTLSAAMSEEQRQQVKLFVLIETACAEEGDVPLKAIYDRSGLRHAAGDARVEGYSRYYRSGRLFESFWRLLNERIVKDSYSMEDTLLHFAQDFPEEDASSATTLVVDDIHYLRDLSHKIMWRTVDGWRGLHNAKHIL